MRTTLWARAVGGCKSEALALRDRGEGVFTGGKNFIQFSLSRAAAASQETGWQATFLLKRKSLNAPKNPI